MKGTILLVEDEPPIRDLLGYTLMKEGYALRAAATVEQARSLLSQEKPDLVLLDWMLPGMSGIDYAGRIRNNPETRDIPIIMLTARDGEADTVRGLDTGVDDYVTKPFSTRELLARIRAVLRRARGQDADGVVRVKELVLDPNTFQVAIGEQAVETSPTEFRLLHFLVTHQERVHTRDQLLDQVWGRDVYIEDRTVDVHIRRLRRNLEPHGYDRCIRTVRSVGYLFSAKG